MKREKDPEKENRLLESAFKLFTEKSIKETSIQGIVDDANVAKGTFYLYFKDKYELRDVLIERKSKKLFNDAVQELRKNYIKNLKMNKVSVIAQEIGKQPVLGFGNSSGDTSMLNYTVYGNKYKSAAFFVICDDLTREFGNTAKAESCRKLAKENGWLAISMKDDWKTIYGDNVKRN